MALWVDKYRPHSLQDLTEASGSIDLQPQLTSKLTALAHSAELPHLLVYGPPGAGKKTRVQCLLREIFGEGASKVKLEHRTFKTSTNKAVDISTIGSNYHIECNPSDVGNNDRFVIQEVIKEIASHSTLTSHTSVIGSGSSGSSSSSSGSAGKSFKVVLITEADRLSKQAQAGLRRTMEKYSSQCRIILLCNSASKIIEPVRSRCLALRVPAPSVDALTQLLLATAAAEGCQCPPELAQCISQSSERNTRRALLMLEAAKAATGPGGVLAANQPVQLPDWQLYIAHLAREILQEQSPSKLLHAREMLYELLTNCIPSDVIMQQLVAELMKSLDDTLKHEVAHWAAYYEHRLCVGSKDIFHLEAFVAKFMAVYKKWIVSLFG